MTGATASPNRFSSEKTCASASMFAFQHRSRQTAIFHQPFSVRAGRFLSTTACLNRHSNELMVKEMVLLLIEEKRQQMIELALTYGLTAKETIECSQQLDQLINEYLRQTGESKQSCPPIQ